MIATAASADSRSDRFVAVLSKNYGGVLLRQAEDILVRLMSWEAENPGDFFVARLIADQDDLVQRLEGVTAIAHGSAAPK